MRRSSVPSATSQSNQEPGASTSCRGGGRPEPEATPEAAAIKTRAGPKERQHPESDVVWHSTLKEPCSPAQNAHARVDRTPAHAKR
eukprot:scaffold54700_cov19-Tisochrysis_lutea.AAC.1